MPAAWIGLGMGALNMFTGMGQAGASSQQAALQAWQAQQAQQNRRLQFAHQEFLNRMQIQQKNREIARANATRWINNKNIALAANQTRAEEEFWLGWNFDNDLNMMSKKHKQVNDQLLTNLTQRNINWRSGTARQLLRASLEKSKEAFADRRMSHTNAMRGAERKQLMSLSKRDFGYNAATTYIPGFFADVPTVDPQSAGSMAYQTGMVSALMGGISAGLQGAALGAQLGDISSEMGGVQQETFPYSPSYGLNPSFEGPTQP